MSRPPSPPPPTSTQLVRAVPCRAPDRPRVLGTLLVGTLTAVLVAGIATRVAAPRIGCVFAESKVDVAKLTIAKLAFEAYPRWRAANPSSVCPTWLGELTTYTSDRDVLDPWGRLYRMQCRSDGQLVVWSRGWDGVAGTADDLRSD